MAIVIDEVTDVALAQGLVVTVRDQIGKYKEDLSKGDLKIIIAGTGLDDIRYPNPAGTSPSYSRLVTLNSPDIDALARAGQISPAVRKALDTGIYSRVLKTNVRMFFSPHFDGTHL